MKGAQLPYADDTLVRDRPCQPQGLVEPVSNVLLAQKNPHPWLWINLSYVALEIPLFQLREFHPFLVLVGGGLVVAQVLGHETDLLWQLCVGRVWSSKQAGLKYFKV